MVHSVVLFKNMLVSYFKQTKSLNPSSFNTKQTNKQTTCMIKNTLQITWKKNLSFFIVQWPSFMSNKKEQ